MAVQRMRERADRRRQDAHEVRVALREPDPAARHSGRGPHGQALLLGERDGRLPPAARVDIGARDQYRVARRLEQRRELGELRRVGERPAGDDSTLGVDRAILVGLGVPVVHRDRHERRAPGRQRGVMDRAADRARDVLRARRLVTPLHVGLRPDGGVAVGQQRLVGDLSSDLLAGGDHQRRLVRHRVEDPADRVADPGRGVQVHVGRAAGRLRVPVRHPDDHKLLEAEDVREIVGKVGQHRQLGRAGVAENRRHPVGAEQVECRFSYGGHFAGGTLLAVGGWSPAAARAPSERCCRRSGSGARAAGEAVHPPQLRVLLRDDHRPLDSGPLPPSSPPSAHRLPSRRRAVALLAFFKHAAGLGPGVGGARSPTLGAVAIRRRRPSRPTQIAGSRRFDGARASGVGRTPPLQEQPSTSAAARSPERTAPSM